MDINHIKKLMNEVNQECFGGELSLNFEIKIINTSRTAACVYRSKINDLYITHWMGVSKNYNWNDEILKNVIAHELIHVYGYQKDNECYKHGYKFKAKMNEINHKCPQYKITVRHTMTSTKVKKAKKVELLYLLSEDRKKIVFVKKSLVLNFAINKSFKIAFGNYTIAPISQEIFESLKYRTSLKYRGYFKTSPELLQKLNIA